MQDFIDFTEFFVQSVNERNANANLKQKGLADITKAKFSEPSVQEAASIRGMMPQAIQLMRDRSDLGFITNTFDYDPATDPFTESLEDVKGKIVVTSSLRPLSVDHYGSGNQVTVLPVAFCELTSSITMETVLIVHKKLFSNANLLPVREGKARTAADQVDPDPERRELLELNDSVVKSYTGATSYLIYKNDKYSELKKLLTNKEGEYKVMTFAERNLARIQAGEASDLRKVTPFLPGPKSMKGNLAMLDFDTNDGYVYTSIRRNGKVLVDTVIAIDDLTFMGRFMTLTGIDESDLLTNGELDSASALAMLSQVAFSTELTNHQLSTFCSVASQILFTSIINSNCDIAMDTFFSTVSANNPDFSTAYEPRVKISLPMWTVVKSDVNSLDGYETSQQQVDSSFENRPGGQKSIVVSNIHQCLVTRPRFFSRLGEQFRNKGVVIKDIDPYSRPVPGTTFNDRS